MHNQRVGAAAAAGGGGGGGPSRGRGSGAAVAVKEWGGKVLVVSRTRSDNLFHHFEGIVYVCTYVRMYVCAARMCAMYMYVTDCTVLYFTSSLILSLPF